MKNTLTFRLFLAILFFSVLPLHAGAQETVPLPEEEFFTDIPVVLTATRLAQPSNEAPAAVTIIDREMIEASGAREIADLFQLVPGFVVSHANGYTPIVMYHGLSDEYARRMQVLIDGRSVYSPTAGGVEWTNLALTIDDIERIEVIRGPNAASFGSNSFLSIINITTYNAVDTTGAYAKVVRGTDSINDTFLRVGNTKNDFSYQLSVGYNNDDGFNDRDDDHYVRMAKFRSDFQINSSNTVMFQLGSNTGPRESHEYTLQTTVDRQIDNNFAQIQWTHQVDANEELSLHFFHNSENTEEFFDVTLLGLGRVVADNLTHGERSDIEFQHSLPITQSARIVWGLGARQDSSYGVDVYGTNPATGYVGGKKVFYNKMLRAFGNLEWRLNERLLINTGAMLENSDLAENQISPRVGLNFLFNSKHSMRFTASQATRTPTLRETYDNYRVPIYGIPSQPVSFVTTLWKGNQDLSPELITAYEVGYHAIFDWKKLTFDIKFFREEVRDLISPDQNQVADPTDLFDGEYEVIDNLTDSDITGGELALEINPTKSSRLILSHSHTNLVSKNPNISSDILAESAPEYITSLLIINRFTNNATGSLLYTKVSKSNGLGSGDAVDGHDRLDLRLGYEFGTSKTRGEIGFVAQNLLGKYIDWATSPEPDQIIDTRRYVFLKLLWD